MKNKKKKKHRNKKVRLALQILLLVFLLTLLALGIIFYVKYGNTILKIQQDAKKTISQSNIDTFRQAETSLVYDNRGKMLSVLKGEKDVYYLYYEDIPPMAVDAIISIEDKQFETHKGVDIKANIRAVLALIKHKGEITQGASTITQQLCRNVFLTHEVSWERKMKEIFLALELEKKYSKYQIMEFYLNNVYFSNGYYGIQAASKGYLSKNAADLSLSEITFLCAIPNNPTLYDPVERMENTIKRRDRILDQMLLDGKISQEEYNQAVNEEIVLEQSSISKKNYIETYVNYCAARALMKSQGFKFRNEFKDDGDRENYDELYNEAYNDCQRSLYSGGYRIYTSIDTKKQKKLQEVINDSLKDYKEKNKEGIFKLQGAAVCIDNASGRVEAIVGGRGQKTHGYTLNRGYQSFRQPGSAIKPLIVYTPLFERDYTPETIIEDKKIEDGPKNTDGAYGGKMTVRAAVEKSKNTVAWSLFEELTPRKGMAYLLNMNFSKISANDYFPAAALGGFTIGCSPVEMTSAYAAIANEGRYREPTCIVKIMDAKGNEIVPEQTDEKEVYEAEASRMMTDVLKSVMESGTGRNVAISNMTCAGKTGTTNDKKDGWFVGFTPYYTTGVWVGYDMPKKLDGLAGSTYPGRIWKAFMEWLNADLEKKEFPLYDKPRPTKAPVVKTPEPEITLEPEATEEPEATLEPEVTLEPEEGDIPLEGSPDLSGEMEGDPMENGYPDGTENGQPTEEPVLPDDPLQGESPEGSSDGSQFEGETPEMEEKDPSLPPEGV